MAGQVAERPVVELPPFRRPSLKQETQEEAVSLQESAGGSCSPSAMGLRRVTQASHSLKQFAIQSQPGSRRASRKRRPLFVSASSAGTDYDNSRRAKTARRTSTTRRRL